MKSKSWILRIAIGAVLVMGLACESKFAEKSPDDGTNAVGALTLQDRVDSKTTLDQKLNEIELVAVKTKEILAIFRKHYGSNYTTIDLLADLSRELKRGIPKVAAGSYVKEARFVLPVKSISEECRIVDVMFKTTSEAEAGLDISQPIPLDGQISDSASISLRTCKSNGEYLEAFTLKGHNGSIDSLQMRKDALDQLIPVNEGGELAKIHDNCRFSKDEAGDISNIFCQNLSVSLTKNSYGLVKALNFDRGGDPRFEMTYSIFENGADKLDSYFMIDKHFVPHFLGEPGGLADLTN